MRRTDLIKTAALHLLQQRDEDPDGVYVRHLSRGRVEKTTYMEQAEKDVQTVLDHAVPGFLDGKVEVMSTGAEY